MKLWKSKTLDFNVLVPAIYGFLSALGMEIPEDVMVGVLAIGNFILRLITKEPVSAKQ
jgi:hypothetical protein